MHHGGRHRWRILGLSAVITIMVFPLVYIVPQEAEAHTITSDIDDTDNFCIRPHRSESANLLHRDGPAHQDWIVEVAVGLDGGNDARQPTRIQFRLIDGNSLVVDEWRFPTYRWERQDVYIFRETLQGHINDRPTLWYRIFNEGNDEQCFDLGFETAYY